MARFHWLERLELTAEGLTIHLSELLAGAPDGGIGLPLLATDDSQHFRVHFQSVGSFRTIPETFNEVSDQAEKLGNFLFQERSSRYLSDMSDAARLGAGIPNDGALLHYVIYTENHVVDVLTAQPPSITVCPAVGR